MPSRRSIDKREFLRLVSLARWVDCPPGEVTLGDEQQISEAIGVIAGDLEAILGNDTRMALPGDQEKSIDGKFGQSLFGGLT